MKSSVFSDLKKKRIYFYKNQGGSESVVFRNFSNKRVGRDFIVKLIIVINKTPLGKAVNLGVGNEEKF